MATKWTMGGGAKWGDMDPEAEDGRLDSPSNGPQVSIFETALDSNGIKTVTEIHTDENGKRVKVTRKVKVTKKVVKVNKAVLQRRKWAKFGDCKGLAPGPEKNVTYHSIESINLKLRPKKREDEKQDDALERLRGNDSIVVCRNCGETGHWTLRCPKRNQITVGGISSSGSAGGSDSQDARGAGKSTDAGGRWIPLHLREGAKDKQGASMHTRDDSCTIRVTNISEDATEDDLRDLFRPFGHTSRVYLARDRNTNTSRGFAFISYLSREAAQMAIDKLNGYGYGNLILRVEFSRPREEDPNRSYKPRN